MSANAVASHVHTLLRVCSLPKAPLAEEAAARRGGPMAWEADDSSRRDDGRVSGGTAAAAAATSCWLLGERYTYQSLLNRCIMLSLPDPTALTMPCLLALGLTRVFCSSKNVCCTGVQLRIATCPCRGQMVLNVSLTATQGWSGQRGASYRERDGRHSGCQTDAAQRDEDQQRVKVPRNPDTRVEVTQFHCKASYNACTSQQLAQLGMHAQLCAEKFD